MDKIIGQYPKEDFDEDLFISSVGIVFQKDMSQSVEYDADYFENYVLRKGTTIAHNLNLARANLSSKYCNCVIDIGIGCGEFVNYSEIKTYGYDINPVGKHWLKDRNLFIDIEEHIPEEIEGFTCWDVIEHMPKPSDFLDKIRSGQHLFVSIPTFDNLTKVRYSKHFKPNEHYYYYSKDGFCKFLEDSGFELLEDNDQETKAGREGIHSFAFIKK